MTNEPRKHWDEQLRAALTERANSIDAVTSWTPPSEHRPAHRYPWRWLTPLAAAAAVALIAIGVAVTRLAADRDVRPVSPAPPTATAPAPPTTATATRVTAPTTATAPTTTSETPPPTVPGRSTVQPPRTTVGSAPADSAPTTTVASTTEPSTTVPSAPPPQATIAPCMRNHTYEQVTAEWSGVYGTQFFAQSELARCGGPDDVNWFPTGRPFPVHLTAITRILVLRSGGNGDQAITLDKFPAYLAHPFTGLFYVTGPSTHPTELTEMYHP